MSWEVLCPNCRSTRDPQTVSLKQVRRSSHCEICQIKFDAEFDKSVELKFAVNAAVRHVARQTFCLAGPGGKPHIIGQFIVGPGQRRPWKLPDLRTPHRLRSQQVSQALKLEPEKGFNSVQPVVICQPTGFEVRLESSPANDGEVQFVNPNRFPLLLVIERSHWSPDILTAAAATNWQEFRDLFSGEVISPDEQITVGRQIILFTDLRGSTAMYCGIGDAPAYAVVRDHFRLLSEVIHEHHGSIVKTIGDAVMAVFTRVEEGLQAVQKMHTALAQRTAVASSQLRLVLKSSLHLGPCLAVNANDKLDFFGTTINLAARMIDRCQGGDVTISDEFYQQPETAEFLRSLKSAPEPAEVTFRSFAVRHNVWRIPLQNVE